MHRKSQAQRPTLFYDGACPLCSREIAHYRRIDRSERVDWRDLHSASDALQALGLDRETAMRRIHAVTADGRLVNGVAAFTAVWEQLPGYRYLARLLYAVPPLQALLERLYGPFADWRYRRRCVDGSCPTAGEREGTP